MAFIIIYGTYGYYIDAITITKYKLIIQEVGMLNGLIGPAGLVLAGIGGVLFALSPYSQSNQQFRQRMFGVGLVILGLGMVLGGRLF